MNHGCESCTLRYNSYPKTPYKIGNNRFFRNFPPPIIERTSRFSNFCCPTETPLTIQPEPLLPAGTNRPKRKNPKMIGKRNAPVKKIIKRKSLQSPKISCPSVTPVTDPCLNMTLSTEPEASRFSEICDKNPISIENYAGDCACLQCDNNEPSAADAESFVEGNPSLITIGDGPSTCSMSKASEKNMANYLFDNQFLRESTSKKQSACAEVIDCLDDDSEVWILQCPKCFDVNKIVNAELSKKNGKSLDVCSDRFKTCMNMICLAPEKAAEYKSICDDIKLIRPVGKILVTEAQPDVGETCSEDDQTEAECSDIKAADSIPLASKKVQKNLNDQRFTIETTVTVESVNDRCAGKKSKKPSIKQESNESCIPICPPQPQPMKRKKKNC